MTELSELMDYVKKKGYSTVPYDNVTGDSVYLSCGIRGEFLNGEDNFQKIIDAIRRFQKKDYGDASEHGKTPRPGHEYGRYDITDLPAEEGEDTGVWIHKDGNSIIAFYYFER